MFYSKIIGLFLLVSFSLIAEEPSVKAQYYSADAVQAIPRLKALTKQDPEYNKIVFTLDGFPKNQEIIFEVKRLADIDPKGYEQKFTFTIQDDNTFLIKDSDHRIQKIMSSSHGYLPGETVFYRFRTADDKISKEVSGIPTPAEIKDADFKTVIKADLVSINPTVYNISLPALDDGEQYELKSTSLGETTKAKPKHTKNKSFHITPGGKTNRKGGEAVLEIKRKSGKRYSIVLPWGTGLNGYLKGKAVYSPKP